jgi:hypothetical protein
MEGTATAPRQLRAMGITDLIDATFTLYRNNFALFAGVVAVLTVPQTIINMVIAALTPSTDQLVSAGNFGTATAAFAAYQGAITARGGSGLIGGIFTVLITGALAHAVANRYLDRPETVSGAYREVGIGPFVRLFLAPIVGVLALLLVVLAVAAVLFLAALAVPSLTGLAVVLGIILGIAAIPVGVYVGTHFYLVPQAIVLEKRGIIDSFKRSWYLVHGYFWHVFGLVALVGLMVSILSSVVGGVIGALSFSSPVAGAALGGVLSILLQPISLGATTLLYFDQRVRKEGFDLEFAAERAVPLTR